MRGGSSFAPGDRVEAQFNGKDKSYPATVKKDNGDDTYALEYDDGDKEDAAKAEHIKAMSAERDDALRPWAAREQYAAEHFFGWMANYGCCVSKAEGERRRREALEQARQRQAEVAREFAQLKAEYEAARANGAPNDTVRAAPPRSERGARGARARL